MSAMIGVALRDRLEVHFHLGGMHAFGMLVQFGATGAPPHLRHLGHLADQTFGQVPMRLIPASEVPGLSITLTVSVPSLNGGSEGAGRTARWRRQRPRRRRPRPAGCRATTSPQQPRIPAFEPDHQRAVAVCVNCFICGSR